jgi:hypothetical protein
MAGQPSWSSRRWRMLHQERQERQERQEHDQQLHDAERMRRTTGMPGNDRKAYRPSGRELLS